MTKNENYSYPFYQEMIQKMKNCTDALNPDDEMSNKKMYAVCDLAMGIVSSRLGELLILCCINSFISVLEYLKYIKTSQEEYEFCNAFLVKRSIKMIFKQLQVILFLCS